MIVSVSKPQWNTGGSWGTGSNADDGGWSQGPPASGSGWTGTPAGKYPFLRYSDTQTLQFGCNLEYEQYFCINLFYLEKRKEN